MQLIRVGKASNIAAVLRLSETAEEMDVIMLTANGQIKRTPLNHFVSMSSRGLIAIKLKVRRTIRDDESNLAQCAKSVLQDGDSLKFVRCCSTDDNVLLTSSHGFALRFPVSACPRLSASAVGCKACD